MTPRTTINFFRGRTGAFLLFLVLLVIGYVLVNGFKAPDFRRLEREEGTTSTADKSERKSQVVEAGEAAGVAANQPLRGDANRREAAGRVGR